MLQLRVYGDTAVMTAVVQQLETLPGTRHVTVSDTGRERAAMVTADVRPATADEALQRVYGLGVPSDDVALVRLETVGAADEGEPLVLVWADVLGQAHIRARLATRYLVLMSVAGVIAGLGVLNNSSILIVGAMAISPDLLPVTAACTGFVLRRPRLVARGLATLALGLFCTGLLAAVVTALLDLLDRLPAGFSLHRIPVTQTHVTATTVLVALAAGIAGMLAVETRASAAVGVAISVTTIPASAYLGVAAGLGGLDQAWSGLAVLVVNVAMMLTGGSIVLAVQRRQSTTR